MKFKELSKAEKLALFEAWIDGKTIEFYDVRCWQATSWPAWSDDTEYRIATIPPSIDWDAVSKEFNYLTVDDIGGLLHKTLPTYNDKGDYWRTGTDIAANATYFSSFKPGNCLAKDSLVKRPTN